MIRRTLLPLAAITAIAAPVAHAAKPVAHAAANCKLSKAENGGSTPSSLGPNYVYQGKFSASGVSCGKAKKVAKGYYKACKGNTSSCAKTIKGFKCSQKATAGVGTYDAQTSCKKGSARVSFLFTADK